VPIAGLDLKDLRSRLIVAEHPESVAEAKGPRLAESWPRGSSSRRRFRALRILGSRRREANVLSVTVPYVPLSPSGGWDGNREIITNRVIATLENFALA